MSQTKLISGARILLTLFVWLFAVVLAHHALHTNAQVVSQLLVYPVVKLLAAAGGLSLLIYLTIWSLPQIGKLNWRGSLTILVWSVLIVIGHGVTHLGESNTAVVLNQLQDMMGLTGFILLTCIYALFLAMPFVAGVEIGLLIMAVFGVPGVLVAYGGTLIGLNLAFGVGRLLPASLIQTWSEKLGLQHHPEDFDDLLERLVNGQNWLCRLGGLLLRSRYVTLAICLNFPGNSVVGGGGGLSLLAGMSKRLIYWPYFLLMTAIATSPVPLLVLFGFLNMDGVTEHSGWLHDFLDMLFSWLPLT
ncbi:MAG: hypothetical protein GYB20_11490 [Oceanospirillales bacterium]|nr:hypothetical protein [Oceanospirillales bacterium]MBR9888301.1 hypothetical protein [Oceanospirillales bacterium]